MKLASFLTLATLLAIRRQPLSLPNMISIRLRRLYSRRHRAKFGFFQLKRSVGLSKPRNLLPVDCQ
jgi:hypothetical protein